MRIRKMLCLTVGIVSLAACSTGCTAQLQDIAGREEQLQQTEIPQNEIEETEQSITSEPENDPEEQSDYVKKEKKIEGYTVQKAADIPDPEKQIYFYSDILMLTEGERVKLLTPFGEDKLSQTYDNIVNLGNGYYSVTISTDDINSTGLVDASGKQLIPCETAQIARLGNSQDDYESDRFLRVIYTTGVTDKEEECIIYSTDRMISLGPNEEDTMYKGYVKVYDLQAQDFVGDLEVTNGDQYAIRACGDHLMIEDEQGINTLYDSDGKEIFQTSKYVEDVIDGYFLENDLGTYHVYDQKGDTIYTSNNSIRLADGNGCFIQRLNDDGYTLLDITGKVLSKKKYGAVYRINDDVVDAQTNNLYELTDIDGNVLLEGSDERFNYAGAGYWYLYKDQDGEKVCDVLDAENHMHTALSTDVNISSEDLCFGKEAADGYEVYVFQDAAYSLKVDDTPERLARGIFKVKQDSDGLYGVYETFTGTQLLECVYETVEYADGYLYGYRAGSWEVYQVSGPEL